MENQDRINALATTLGLTAEEKEDLEESRYNVGMIEYGREEYLVLTDDEANERVKENISQSIWAFNTDFLRSHSKALHNDAVCKSLKETQIKCGEDANDLVMALIDDFDHFANDAVACDGRGHFLATYDSEEIQQGEFFIYRVN